MHDLIKLRIHSETVTISVPKCNTFAELRERSKRINKYKRFLTKIFNKMAKTIELLPNKIRIKYLVKEKKYYLFYGSQQCMIDSEYQNGFNSFEDAKQKGLNLEVNGYYTKTIK